MKVICRLKKYLLFLFSTLIIVFSLYSKDEFNEKILPEIQQLSYSDINYRQLQQDISFFYKAISSGKELPPLLFYVYSSNNNLNIFSIASQAGIPYDTIASLNRIDNVNDLPKKEWLIPSQAGIFIPLEPKFDIEFIAHSWRSQSLKSAKIIKLNNTEFYFLPNEKYHVVERAYFLNILFCNPLPTGIVSSGYGMRKNPFTGNKLFHNGIDIAAPQGTPVYSAREGQIVKLGNNNTFGNYIEIKHKGGYNTFYGHLSKIFVQLHDNVNSTMIIAEVGNTGLSTGAHLHFEIRQNGDYRNPSKLLPGLK